MTGRKHFALLLGGSLTAACVGGPPTGAGERGAPPPPRGTALLQAVMLGGHAEARAAVGLPPLAWSDTLAASAQAHAEEMARTGRYVHAVQPMDRTRQGENMWRGIRGVYRYDEMVATWVDERRDFVNLPTPNFSRTGRWRDAAHYAQVVWAGTTTVGCAMASSAANDYLVCRYKFPGNVVGQRAY